MKTAVIYARYSSEKQTEQSIEGQLRVCYDYASKNDIKIIHEYIDRAMSGKNDNRASFQNMLRDSNKKVWDYVLVYKLDRFSRNKYEMAIHKKTLKDNGIKVLSAMENIPDTPEGIILESMLEGMAEYYSAELAQKVVRGLNESLEKGQFIGGTINYGYKVINKKVFIDEEKAKVVNRIYQEYVNGKTVKEIINELTQQGIYNNQGKPFKVNAVCKMLHNEKYVGLFIYNGKIYTNIYPRIVPEPLFQSVMKIYDSNKFGRDSLSTKYLLRRKMKCGYCGKLMIGECGKTRYGEIKRYYKCSTKKHGGKCNKCQVKKDEIEQIITNATLRLFQNKKFINKFADAILNKINTTYQEQNTLNLLNKEKAEVEKTINNMLKAIEQGIVTKSTKQRLEELEQNLETLEEKICKEKNKTRITITKDEIINFVKQSIKADVESVLHLLVKEIILYDDKIEVYYKYSKNPNPDDDNQRDFSFHQGTATLSAVNPIKNKTILQEMTLDFKV